jgi:hypothetical protein
VKLYVEEQVVRAAPGGVGEYKVGGNYAPTVAPALEALRAHGATQVLYTYQPAQGPRLVSEGGAMNVLFLVRRRGDGAAPGRELMTAPLDGTILPGVTRDSILELARGAAGTGSEPGLMVSERPVSLDELAEETRTLFLNTLRLSNKTKGDVSEPDGLVHELAQLSAQGLSFWMMSVFVEHPQEQQLMLDMTSTRERLERARAVLRVRARVRACACPAKHSPMCLPCRITSPSRPTYADASFAPLSRLFEGDVVIPVGHIGAQERAQRHWRQRS